MLIAPLQLGAAAAAASLQHSSHAMRGMESETEDEPGKQNYSSISKNLVGKETYPSSGSLGKCPLGQSGHMQPPPGLRAFPQSLQEDQAGVWPRKEPALKGVNICF